MEIPERLVKIAKAIKDKIFLGEEEKIERYVLRYALLIAISVLVFSLISTLVPFSGKSILGWVSQTNGTAGALAYFFKFYIVSMGLLIVPSVLLIALFSLILFVTFFLLRSEIGLRDVVLTTFSSYMPFLIFFWVPVVSWVMLAAALVLLIYKFNETFSLKKSVLVYVLGLILLLAVLAAGFLSIYSVSNYKLAGANKEGNPYLVGSTAENKCGIHRVTHDYEIFYDNALADNLLEIYQPKSYYDTEPVSEITLISYANLQTLNGHLIPIKFGGAPLDKSFPPRLSDKDNPPTKIYYRGYRRPDNEVAIVYFPFWEEQYFPYHPGDMLPVVIWMNDNDEPTRLILESRGVATNINKITLFRKGLSNVKQGLSTEKLLTPFFHGCRVYYSGKDKTVMKYINPIEYVNSEIELPVKIISIAPNHVFDLYTDQVSATKIEPKFIPLNKNTFLEVKGEYPDLANYDIADPFAEPYVYTNYPPVDPIWPENVSENWVEEHNCIPLSPRWVG